MQSYQLCKVCAARSGVHHEFAVHNFLGCPLGSCNGIWLFEAINAFGSKGGDDSFTGLKLLSRYVRTTKIM
jgi:hypothetical protein